MKKCYIVAYETSELNAANMISAIKSFGTWARLNNTCWAIVSSMTTKELRDNLKQSLVPSDKLIVIRSGDSAAWVNFKDSTSNWLKKHIG